MAWISLVFCILIYAGAAFGADSNFSVTLKATRCLSTDTYLGESVGMPVMEMDFDARFMRIMGVESFSMTHTFNSANAPQPCAVDVDAFMCKGKCEKANCNVGTNQLDFSHSVPYNSSILGIAPKEIIELTAEGSHMDGTCVGSGRVATKSPLSFTAKYDFSAQLEQVEFYFFLHREGVENSTFDVQGILREAAANFDIQGSALLQNKIISSSAVMEPIAMNRSGKSVQITLDIHETWRNITEVAFVIESLRETISGKLGMVITLDVEYCVENFTGIKHANCSKHPNASYRSIVFCECRPGSEVYPGLNGTRFSMICDRNAEWVPLNGTECWYAPSVELLIDSEPYFMHENITVFCNVTQGNPGSKAVTLKIGDDSRTLEPNLHTNITAKPEYNGAEVFCSVMNNFTISKELNPPTSNRVSLTVYFEPMELMLCVERDQSGSLNVTITFESNPVVDNVILIAKGKKIGEMPRKRSSLSLQEHSIQNVTFANEDHVSFDITFMNTTKNHMDYRDICTQETSTTTTAGDTSSGPIPTTGEGNHTSNTLTEQAKMIIIITASIATATLMILLIVLVWRKRNKGAKKEEVINPIYDTTNMSASAGGISSGGDSEKVERDNPLYGTTAEATYAPVKKKKKPKKDSCKIGNVHCCTVLTDINFFVSAPEIPEATANETYATVVKPKNGKKKVADSGQSNDAFSGEADATYAAVNKKKKRSDKREDEPSTSGLGNNAQVSEDCTYAAVQKKGKRKPKDDDDEDLHGSSK